MADEWDVFPDAEGGTATLDWDAFPDADEGSPPKQPISSELGEARAFLRGMDEPVTASNLILSGGLSALPKKWSQDTLAGMVGLGTDVTGAASRLNARGPGRWGMQAAEGMGLLKPGATEEFFAPNERIADDLHRQGKAFEQAAAEGDAPGLPGMMQKGGRNLVRSLPPAVVAARGGPYAAIAPAVATTYSTAITEGKDAGLEGPALERYAATQASTEGLVAAAFQKIGLGGQEKLLAQTAIKSGAGKAIKDYLLQTGGEFLEETAIALGQALSNYAEGVDPKSLDPEKLATDAAQLAVTTLMGTSAAASPQVAGAAMLDRQRGQELADVTTRRAAQQEARDQFMSQEGVTAEMERLRQAGTLNELVGKETVSRSEWERMGLPQRFRNEGQTRKEFLASAKGLATRAPANIAIQPALAETVEDIPRPDDAPPATDEGRIDPATRINDLLAQGPVSISDGKWTYQVIGLLDDKVRTKGGKLLPLAKVASGEYSVTPLAPMPTGKPKAATPVAMDPTLTDTSAFPSPLHSDPIALPAEDATPEAANISTYDDAKKVEDAQPSPVPQESSIPEAIPAPVSTEAAPPGEVAGVEAATKQPWEMTAYDYATQHSRRLAELRESKPRPLDKLYGKRGPTPEQSQEHAVATKEWNRQYRTASKLHKEHLADQGAHKRFVAQAVAGGKSVPPEVLADYEPRPTTMEARGPAPDNLHVPVSLEQGSGRPISEHDIIATLSKDFGVPIRKGRMAKPKHVAGIYKVLPEVIRTRGKFAGDLAVLSHEVAHHIDKGQGNVSRIVSQLDPAMKAELENLDYDPKKRRDFEGFAEYVRMLWTTDDAAQAAPRFHQWFDGYLASRPELKSQFDRAKNLMTQWREQGASSRFRVQRQQRGWQPRVLDQPLWEQIKSGARAVGKRLTYELADRFNVIHQIDKEVLGAGFDPKGDATAGQLAAAYNMATAAHAERALMDGVHTVSKKHKLLGKGLRHAFTPLKQGEYEEWADYHLARHVVDVENETRPHPLAESPYNPGMRYEDAHYLMDQVRSDPDKAERFEQVSQALTQINNDRIEMLVDAGILSQEDAEKMLSKWGRTYTSLRRVKPNDLVSRLTSSLLEIKQPVRKRSEEGSALPVMDPVEATVLNLMEAYDSALKQQVMVKLAEETIPEFGGIEGMGEFVELIPANRKSTTGTVEEILKSLKEAGFDPDLIKEISIVTKMRRDEAVSKQSLEWLAGRYGVDPTTEFAIDDILDKTDGVPDAETAIAIWRPDYSPNKNERIIRMVYRGQPRMIQLSPELYSALQGMNPIQIHPMLRSLQLMTRLTKLGATSLNVGFAGANVLADYPAFLAQTSHTSGFDSFYLPLISAIWNARAEIPQIAGDAVGVVSPQLGDKVKRGIDFGLEAVAGKTHPVVELWNEFGGKVATRLGADKTTLRNVRGDITGQHGVGLWERGSRAVDALRDTIGLFEAGPRIAEFTGYLQEHGYTVKGGKLVETATGQPARPPRGVLIGATLAARDVTTDFTRAGRAGRFADQFLAFFNAAVQSNIKFAKTIKEIGTGQKNWKQRAVALSGMASAALVYALLRGDDDDYREQPEWLKRRYWTFGQGGQTWYRIRKPHDWAIVSNMIEQFVAMWKEKDPQSLAQFVTEEIHARNPVDPTSVSGMPFVEAGSNYSFFRRGPIENERMQDVAPEHRSYPWTSPAAKFIGHYTGKSVGWGPAKIDYVLNETSGGLWGRTAGAENLESAAQKWSGGSSFALNKDYPEAVESFYDALGKAQQAAASAKFLGKDNQEASAEATRLGKYAELMKEIRKPVNQAADRDKRFSHERYNVGLARHVLGLEELESYPNPLSRTDLPVAVQSAVDEHLGGLAMAAAENEYTERQAGQEDAAFASKQAERQASISNALDALREAGLPQDRWQELLAQAARKRGYGGEAIGSRLGRLAARIGD